MSVLHDRLKELFENLRLDQLRTVILHISVNRLSKIIGWSEELQVDLNLENAADIKSVVSYMLVLINIESRVYLGAFAPYFLESCVEHQVAKMFADQGYKLIFIILTNFVEIDHELLLLYCFILAGEAQSDRHVERLISGQSA